MSLGERRSSLASVGSRRSSSEVIKRMLYGSATKEDLKNRDSLEEDNDYDDSDVTSDETDGGNQRKSLPKYILKKTTSAGRINFKLRRNSVEDSSERDASPSPPLNLDRPRLGQGSSRTLPRRTKSSSNSNIIAASLSQNNRKTSYAFGSSTERFCNKPENDQATRSSQDNLSGITFINFYIFIQLFNDHHPRRWRLELEVSNVQLQISFDILRFL